MERPFKYSESDRELESVINKYLKPSSFSASSQKSTKETRESSSVPLSNLTNQYLSHQDGKILPNFHEQSPTYEKSPENYQQMNYSPTTNHYISNIRLENDPLKVSANTFPINQNSFILTSASSGFKSSKYENQDLVKAKYESDLAICNFWRKFNSTDTTLEKSYKEPLSFLNLNSNTTSQSQRTRDNQKKEHQEFQTPKTKKEEKNAFQKKKDSMIPFEDRSNENLALSIEKPETNLETFGQTENFFSPKSGDTDHNDILEERLSFSNEDYVKTSNRGEYMFQKDTIARDLDEHKTKNAPKNRASQKNGTIVEKNGKNNPKTNRKRFGRSLVFLFILALVALCISYFWGHAWKFYN